MANRAVEEYASNSDTSNANDTSSFAYGAAGSNIPSVATSAKYKDVQFQSPILDSDIIKLEIYDGSGNWHEYTSAGNNGGFPYELQNSVSYGIFYSKQSSTKIRVYFNTYAYNRSATYGGVGTAWSSVSALKWRVRKVSGGASVGYPISARNVVGDTSGTVVPSGFVGEVINGDAISSSVSVGTSSTAVSSITLTPGVWALKFFTSVIYTTGASSGNNGYVIMKIRDSGDSTTLGTTAIVAGKTVAAVANYVESTVSGEYIANINASTTYLLRATRADSSGTGSGYVYNGGATEVSKFYAVRIA